MDDGGPGMMSFAFLMMMDRWKAEKHKPQGIAAPEECKTERGQGDDHGLTYHPAELSPLVVIAVKKTNGFKIETGLSELSFAPRRSIL
jgi:hypothetical protein